MPSEPTREDMIEALRRAISDIEAQLDPDGPGYTAARREVDALDSLLRELEAGGGRIDGQTLVEAARELVRQIANNDFRDGHGHDAVNLRAYAVLQRFVSLPTPPATSDGGEG